MARMDSDMTEGNIWMHLIRYSKSVLVRGDRAAEAARREP